MSKISVTLKVEGLVTFQEAADALEVTRPNIYHLIESGKLHAFYIGETPYVPSYEVERLKGNNHRKENT